MVALVYSWEAAAELLQDHVTQALMNKLKKSASFFISSKPSCETTELKSQKIPRTCKSCGVKGSQSDQLRHHASCLFFPQERKLCAFPFIEVCSSDVIKYMAPLSRQTDFFVPEMKEEVKTDVKEEDSDEDRGTDITGKSCDQQTGLSDCVCIPWALVLVHNWSWLMGQREDFATSIMDSKLGSHIFHPVVVRNEKMLKLCSPVSRLHRYSMSYHRNSYFSCCHCIQTGWVMGLSRCCHKQEVYGRIVCLCCGSWPAHLWELLMSDGSIRGAQLCQICCNAAPLLGGRICLSAPQVCQPATNTWTHTTAAISAVIQV